MVETNINFNGINSSNELLHQMPHHYNERFLKVSQFFFLLSFFSFVASYYEVEIIFTTNNLLCLIGIICSISLGIITKYSSLNIIETINGI
jgi:hypothetical protein